MNPKTTEPCYVILRRDEYTDVLDEAFTSFTVKMVVWSEKEANTQVKRLNGLKLANRNQYYWVVSRAAKKV